MRVELIIIVAVLWMLISFNTIAMINGQSTPPETACTDPDFLVDHVVFLSSLSPARSYQNPVSLDQAVDYIRDNFKKYSKQVMDQDFQVKGKVYKNVMPDLGLILC